MRKSILALSVLASCCASPIAPTQAEPIGKLVHPAEWHHNIPFTTESGEIRYLCATQPRIYIRDGQQSLERDHYDQPTACPVTPID